MTRFIFITGGVVSSLGKGLATASIGALLQAYGYRVRLRKLDPYLNIDPGTMNPVQHGEVFVTDDGAETDLDLGHYERFTGVAAKKGDNVTSGKIYSKLIAKERRGDYLGGTVQVIPHVTDLIKEFILADTEQEDFVLCEIGGTVGDIEALPFFEAIRQLSCELPSMTMFVHLTLVPFLQSSSELKTKPTQHSVKELRSIGIQPNMLLCRSQYEISVGESNKIGLFCNLNSDYVITAIDVDSIYKVPLEFHNRQVDKRVLSFFNMEPLQKPNFGIWYDLSNKISSNKKIVNIAFVGKYISLKDAYKSYVEAFVHAGIENDVKVVLHWLDARIYDKENNITLQGDIDAIVIPGGFGNDGIEGKIAVIQYARENKIPFLGVCLGMQLAIIEFARNVCNIKEAYSTEFGDSGAPIIAKIEEWDKSYRIYYRDQMNHDEYLMRKANDLGGTMRLGAYRCEIVANTLAYSIYQSYVIAERHRHRYEFNINYRQVLEDSGIVFSGTSSDNQLIEIMEYKEHPWFLGVQFHPELTSSPFKCHPIFRSFVKAAISYQSKVD